LSAALILLIVIHLIWRAIGVPDPSNIKEIIKLKYIEIPVTHVINFFNEIHPWRFSSRFLVLLLIIFLIIGSFLNLTRISPFHQGGSLLAIPSFEVVRSNFRPSEQLSPGGILELLPGEKAVITLTIRGKTQVSCTWFTASGSRIIQQGCTILLDVPSSLKSDIVTVFIQPICGSEKHSASLNVIVQP
jgi:hypothetical protein